MSLPSSLLTMMSYIQKVAFYLVWFSFKKTTCSTGERLHQGQHVFTILLYFICAVLVAQLSWSNWRNKKWWETLSWVYWSLYRWKVYLTISWNTQRRLWPLVTKSQTHKLFSQMQRRRFSMLWLVTWFLLVNFLFIHRDQKKELRDGKHAIPPWSRLLQLQDSSWYLKITTIQGQERRVGVTSD